jgi:hypothetical protein
VTIRFQVDGGVYTKMRHTGNSSTCQYVVD